MYFHQLNPHPTHSSYLTGNKRLSDLSKAKNADEGEMQVFPSFPKGHLLEGKGWGCSILKEAKSVTWKLVTWKNMSRCFPSHNTDPNQGSVHNLDTYWEVVLVIAS